MKNKIHSLITILIKLAAIIFISTMIKIDVDTVMEIQNLVSYKEIEHQWTMKSSALFVPKHATKKSTTPKYRGNIKDFMNSLAKFESKGNTEIVNQFGNMGKYQFNPRTLKSLGIHTTQNEFLTNEALQDSAMVLFMKTNYNSLKLIINKFAGTWKDEIYITKSGILAAAHLVGVGGVLAYFNPEKYNYNLVDGNGVHMTMYLKKFGNYNINFSDLEK